MLMNYIGASVNFEWFLHTDVSMPVRNIKNSLILGNYRSKLKNLGGITLVPTYA
jgi:hypothetical protein